MSTDTLYNPRSTANTFHHALQMWELNQHDSAFSIVNQIIDSGNYSLEVPITKIKWLLILGKTKEALQHSLDLWNQSKVSVVGDVLATMAKKYMTEFQSTLPSCVSNEILNRICSSYVTEYASKQKTFTPFKSTPHNKVIWQCWFQGEKDAPEIVKKCLSSVRKHTPDFSHILITNKNMYEYIDISEDIKHKFDSGNISLQHFSDILRCQILSKYGGIWIDSTTLLTDTLPDEIINSDFFVFQHPSRTSSISNWLIASKPDHPLIVMIRDLLELYWKYNDTAIHYFIMHGLFQTAVKEIDSLKDMFEEVPYLSNETPHQLQALLLNEYNDYLIAQIKESTSIHKLTYRAPLHLGPAI